ncbi:hypothetical protein ABTM42_21295, partial [Acinetobacter baumannii]
MRAGAVLKGGLLFATLLMAGCAAQQPQRVNYSLDEQMRQADQAYREARLEDAEPLYRQIVIDHPELKDV